METFAPLFNEGAMFDEDPYFSLSQFDIEIQQQAQAALLPQEAWQDFDKYLPMNQLFQQEEAQPIFMNNHYTETLLYEPLQDKKEWSVKHEYASPESLPESPPLLQSTPDMPLFQSTPHLDYTPPIDFMTWTTPLDSTAKVPIQRLKQNSIVSNAVNAALNNMSTHPTGKQHKKTAHNAIERRYRNNINDRIAELKNAVPALLYAKVNANPQPRSKRSREEDEEEGEDGEEYLDGVAVATKLNKATILRKATEYINHLKRSGDDCRRENQTLQHILNQLPGGQEILKRYHLQKQQRDNEVHQQLLMERELQKQYEQQRKLANRKRAKSSSSSSESSASPPAMSQRAFMAVFMCIAFFSTSPISSPATPHHPHTTHQESVLSSVFKFDDTWSSLRTVVFFICILQLFAPVIKKVGAHTLNLLFLFLKTFMVFAALI